MYPIYQGWSNKETWNTWKAITNTPEDLELAKSMTIWQLEAVFADLVVSDRINWPEIMYELRRK